MCREPISPELVLIDPELAASLDEQETPMIDTPNPTQTADSPSIETLMFKAGLISADDLGELVRDAVVAQRPVAALAIERNLVTPRALELLLADTNEEPPAPEPVVLEPAPEPLAPPVAPPVAPVPPVAPEPPLAPAAVAAVVPAPEPEPEQAPQPVEPTPLHAVIPVDEQAAAYEILVRLTTGDTVRVGDAPSRADAEDVARSTARRFAEAAEWPLVGGRCLRPDLVVSVDLVRRLEDSARR